MLKSRFREIISIKRWVRQPLPYLKKPTAEDYKTEEEFQDAVDIATLRRQKPDLYHFEDVMPRESRVYPNDKFKFLDHPVLYTSHDQYYQAAEKERLAQLEQFHPSDWSLDHDHRITWFGMVQQEKLEAASLQEWEIFDKKENQKINIGFKKPKPKIEKVELTAEQKRQIKIDILEGKHEIDSNKIIKSLAAERIDMISRCEKHYKIISDQFGPEVYFDSVIPFGFTFPGNRFFMGNYLSPADMQKEPRVEIECKESDLFTITLTSLDSNYLEDGNNVELLHYAISNVKKIVTNDDSGKNFIFDRWANYLPPIPAKGSGYHRLVATLYKQANRINTKEIELESMESLSERKFNSREFLLKNQDNITPGAHAFCQVRWDESVRDTFHEKLKMPEPVYQYDHKEVFPVQRPEGIPGGVEVDVVKTWFNMDEPEYPIRTRNPTKKKKIRQVNYNLLQPAHVHKWGGK